MPRIVQMKMRRRRPERFIVELDDEQAIILTPETVLKFGIAPEKEFTDKEFIRILDEDHLRQAKEQAVRYLANRPHSRLELVRKMREKGYRFEIINRALDELEKSDLVNDEEFARLYIQNEIRLRPSGKLLLRQKLASRGISRDLYEPLLKELISEELEMEMAMEQASKFVRVNSRLEKTKLKEKLIRYLLNKGFTWDHLREIPVFQELNG